MTKVSKTSKDKEMEAFVIGKLEEILNPDVLNDLRIVATFDECSLVEYIAAMIGNEVLTLRKTFATKDLGVGSKEHLNELSKDDAEFFGVESIDYSFVFKEELRGSAISGAI